MEPMPLLLACAADDGFAMPMAVTLFSALANLKKGSEAVLYLLDCGISEVNKRRAERVLQIEGIRVSVQWTEIDLRRFQDLWVRGGLNHSTFSRLLLPEIVPEPFERVIYLDADVIVEADLMDLWRTGMKDQALLAVRDFLAFAVGSPGSGLYVIHRSLGLEPDMPYFNSGVQVLNLEVWRSENLAHLALDLLRSNSETAYQADQDGLNAVLAGRWGQLDPRWNVLTHAIFHFEEWSRFSSREEMRAECEWLRDNAFILHYAGCPKPWDAWLGKTRCLRWMHYARRSGWFSPFEYRRWQLAWLKNSFFGSVRRTLRLRGRGG